MPYPNLLIVNLHAMSNRGDAAINLVTLDLLRQIYPSAQITLAANLPAEFSYLNLPVVGSFKTWVWTKNNQNKPTWQIWRFPSLILAMLSLLIWRLSGRLIWINRGPHYDLLRAYTQADVIINCGGNTMYARHWRAIAYWLIWFAQFCALICGKPLIGLPQTLGPFQFAIHRHAAGWLYRRAKLIMVRDQPSYDLAIQQLAIPREKCILTPDLVIYYDQTGLRDVQPPAKPLIGVSVIDWARQYHHFTAQVDYETALATTLEQLIIQGYEIAFFAQSDTAVQGENDSIPAQRIINAIHSQYAHAVQGIWHVPLEPEQLLLFYAQFTLVIATRMHAALLALVAGVPVVPIAYTAKSWGFIQEWGLEGLAMDINHPDAEALTKNVFKLLNELDLWRERVHLKTQALRTECDMVALIRKGIE